MVYGEIKSPSVDIARESISFLSWNLAMLQRPAFAPSHWELCDTEEIIREQILASGPDIVHLQELPALVPFAETHEMVKANPLSHSGNLATLVSHDLLKTGISHLSVEGCALLTTFPAFGLTVANVHLAPGKSGGGKRLTQISQIVAASPTEHLVIIGDTNTRSGDVAAITEAGLTAPRSPGPTWNSFKNRFHLQAPKFRASFTRCFAHPKVEIYDLQVLEGRVIRNDKAFCVSDHFALFGRMRLSKII